MAVTSRKLAAMFSGGRQPRDLALAVFLGIVAGALTGSNLSWAAPVLAAILFNVRTTHFLAAWVTSGLLACLLQDTLENIGRFALDSLPVGHFLGHCGSLLWLALAGWDQYAVAGGAVAGAGLAFVCSLVTYGIAARPNETTPLMRPLGLPCALAGSLAAAVAVGSFATPLAERELWRQLSQYNGADVSARTTELSLWDGHFIVRDLEIGDPENPQRDRLRVARVSGMLSPSYLLRGQLDIQKLVLEGVRSDVARRNLAGGDFAAAGTHESADKPAADVGDIAIDGHLRHWSSVCRQFALLRHWVVAIDRFIRAEETGPAGDRTRLGQRRSQLGFEHPRVVVHVLRVSDLPSGLKLGRKAMLELTDLSTSAALLDRQPQLKIVLPQFAAEIRLEFAPPRVGGSNRVFCTAYDVELPPLVKASNAGAAVQFDSGRARLSGEGTFDRERIDLCFKLDVESLEAQVTGNGPLVGVDPATWNRGLDQLASFHTDFELAGSWASPRLTIDLSQFARTFKHHLQLAGEHDLAASFARKLAAAVPDAEPASIVQASAIEAETAEITTVAARPSEPDASTADTQGLPLSSAEMVTDSMGEIAGSQDEGNAGPPVANLAATLDGSSDQQPFTPSPDAAPSGPATEPAMAASAGMPVYPVTGIDEAALVETLPPNVPIPDEPMPMASRTLPGPVNMAVGHDPNVSAPVPNKMGTASFEEAPAPRENRLSRWSRGVRQTIGRTFSSPDSRDAMEPPVDRANHAAAGTGWFNRRLR